MLRTCVGAKRHSLTYNDVISRLAKNILNRDFEEAEVRSGQLSTQSRCQDCEADESFHTDVTHSKVLEFTYPMKIFGFSHK